jgi:hypothetical protein
VPLTVYCQSKFGDGPFVRMFQRMENVYVRIGIMKWVRCFYLITLSNESIECSLLKHLILHCVVCA